MAGSLRFTDDATIEGLLVPFNSRDTYGTTFDSSTAFHLDMFDRRPLLWHHGQDPTAGAQPIGQITDLRVTPRGVLMKAVLDRAGRFYNQVRDAIKKGAVGLSSGAISHLVQIQEGTGRVLAWPICEGSITPQPSNAHARIEHHTVREAALRAHFQSAGLRFDERWLPATGWPPPELVRQSQRRRLARLNREARQLELDGLQRCLDDWQRQEFRRRAARYRTMTPAQIRAELAQMQRTLDRLKG